MRMIYSMKRKVALVAACIMCSLTASAAEGTSIASGDCSADGSSVQWTLDDAGTLTISGMGATKSYEYKTKIPWYSYREEIQDLVIEEGVTDINSNYFCGLINITSVMLPSTMKKIGGYAFENCQNLESVTLNEGLETISGMAFRECVSLKTIHLPASLTQLPYTAFVGCALSFTVDEANAVYSAVDGVLFNKDKTTLLQCKLSDTEYSVPQGVTSIEVNAFYKCTALTNVEIPNSVTTIGNYAFSDCTSLTSIEIPSSVTTIGNEAFSGCTGLTSVKIPNSVTSINYAFYGCTGLTSIEIPSSVISIKGAFQGCTSLKSIVIPSSVTSIDRAFGGCTGLTSVKIPNSVTTIGTAAFSGCTGLESIEIPSSVTTIGTDAFSGCTGLESIEIPSSVTTIGDFAFHNCIGLKSVTIPGSVTGVGHNAFYGCTNVLTVTISCTPSNAVYDCIRPNLERAELIELHAYENGVCTDCSEPCDHTDSTHTTANNNGNVITESCSKCKVSLATATITATNATYDGTAQETATVAYGTGWTGDRNLTVTYANNVDAGTATASITIGGVTARTTFTIQPKEITGAAVAIEQGASFVYSGEPFTPAVSVTLDGKPLAASDYQVSYAGNVNAGQAMVTVTGSGNYSGSATASFTIAKAPAPTLPAVTVSRNYAVAKVSVPPGIVAGEGSSVSVGTASGSGSEKVAAVALDAKGNLTFTLSGGADGDEIVLPVHLHSPNYEGPITATVTVTLTDKLDQRPLTVKATSTTVPSGGTLELSIGGGSGKGAVTYEVINGTGSASLSGSTLTGGAPGTVTVIATKEGTSQYNPARSQPLVVTIE